MSFRIPIGKVVITEAEKKAVLETLDAGILSPGPKVRAFENAFAEKMCAKFGIMVNSGTDALRIALLAMKERYGWQDGDEVIVPALTFVATVNTVLQAKLKPVFVDVAPLSDYRPFIIDGMPLVEGVITPKTRCILPVDLFGIQAIDDKSSVKSFQNPVIRGLTDSCESLHPLTQDVSCYSFYACHLLTLGVGGMIVTSDPEIASLARSYANHGRNPNFLGSQLSAGHSDIFERFEFLRDGYSCRPLEFQAAIGLERLKTIDDVIVKRRTVAKKLYEALKGSWDLVLQNPAYMAKSHWMMFPIVVAHQDVKAICRALESLGIETRPLFPLLTQPHFQNLFPGEAEKHPIAQYFSQRGFYIGCHEFMTDDDIHYVASTLRFITARTEAAVA